MVAWTILLACGGVKLLPATLPDTDSGATDVDPLTDSGDTGLDGTGDTGLPDPDPTDPDPTTPTTPTTTSPTTSTEPRTVDDLLPGDLVITEIHRDPDAVDDDLGEWFEIWNATGDAVELRGLDLVDDGGEAATLAASVIVPPGGYAVLGRSAVLAENGGVPVDATFAGMTLGNGDDELELRGLNGTLDRVAWDGGWPEGNGAAMSLGSAAPTAAGNDDPGQWCDAVTPFGDGDLGTPGAANPGC